jgi:hypothetical protein
MELVFVLGGEETAINKISYSDAIFYPLIVGLRRLSVYKLPL